MTDRRDNKDQSEIITRLDKIDAKLDPIYDAYTAWNQMTSWGKYLLWLIGAIIGVVLGLKEIFKK